MSGIREAQAHRRCWVVDAALIDRQVAVAACQAVLEAVRPVARLVHVDAYSDYRDGLPSDVEVAQRQLRAMGSRRRRGDPGMAVALDPENEQHWSVLWTYAPWSIHVAVWQDREGRQELATLHDGGTGIDAWLTDSEAEALAARLDGVAVLVLETQLQARHAAAKTARRAARRKALRSRLSRLAGRA